MHIYLFTMSVTHGPRGIHHHHHPPFPEQKPRVYFLGWSLAGVGVGLAIVGVLWAAALVSKLPSPATTLVSVFLSHQSLFTVLWKRRASAG